MTAVVSNEPERLRRDGVYPNGETDPRNMFKHTYYKWTGEVRPPRRGEFYLSGSIIQAWEAPNDLSGNYHIAERVPDPEPKLDVGGFRYVLHGPTKESYDH